jgi:SAM-dependent methyltransferase
MESRIARAVVSTAFGQVVKVKKLEGFEADDGVSTEAFRAWLRAIPRAKVVELGTRRTATGISTVRRDWAAADADYILSDFMPGEDVEVVADAEHLSDTFAPGSVDAIIACSVFEHIRRPWLAAAEIGKVLKPGGRVFVQTHLAFPIHAYPHDYWRFTTEALETLFCGEAGLRNIASFYDFPCSIVTPRAVKLAAGSSFLNVGIVAERA